MVPRQRKRKRQGAHGVDEHTKRLHQLRVEETLLNNQISSIEHNLQHVHGVDGAIVYKTLLMKQEHLKDKLQRVKRRLNAMELSTSGSIAMPSGPPPPPSVRTLNPKPASTRLYPPETHGQMLKRLRPAAASMSSASASASASAVDDTDTNDYWGTKRAYERRHAYNTGKSLNMVVHGVRMCPSCKVDRVVDRESARMVCPRCGESHTFASHIFDQKESDNPPPNALRCHNTNHMENYASQFSLGYPQIPTEVLNAVATGYLRIHSRDPAKVRHCHTTRMIKSAEVSQSYKRAAHRISREISGKGIPELSKTEVQLIMEQRTRIASDSSSRQRSLSNQMFIRQLGRSNDVEVCRLFPCPRTNNVHHQRVADLRKRCHEIRLSGEPTAWQWVMYPE